MQWWFGFIDGKATPETIEIGCRNEHRRARFERASISGRVWKVYDRMCIWDDDIIKGGGVVACHNISPWEVYALARARIIPPPAEIEMRSGADTDRCLDQAIADLCEVSMPAGSRTAFSRSRTTPQTLVPCETSERTFEE